MSRSNSKFIISGNKKVGFTWRLESRGKVISRAERSWPQRAQAVRAIDAMTNAADAAIVADE